MALIRGLGGIRRAKNLQNIETTLKYQTIVLETVWLIWKMRNERVIGEKTITRNQMTQRWEKEMNHVIEYSYTKASRKKEKKDREKALKSFRKMWAKDNWLIEIKEKGLCHRNWLEEIKRQSR